MRVVKAIVLVYLRLPLKTGDPHIRAACNRDYRSLAFDDIAFRKRFDIGQADEQILGQLESLVQKARLYLGLIRIVVRELIRSLFKGGYRWIWRLDAQGASRHPSA